MDPLAHIFFSCALSRAEFLPGSRDAMAIVIISSVAPDVDVLYRAKGIVNYFIHHREFSHSFLGMFALSLPLLALGKIFTPELGYFQLYCLVWMGIISHSLLDFLTVYGVPFLNPFRKNFYNLGLVFIIDPWLYLIFLPAVFEKVISVNKPFSARLSLCLFLFYLIFLSVMKMVARINGKSYLFKQIDGTPDFEIYLSPYFSKPFLWLLLLKKDDVIYRMRFSIISGASPFCVFKSDDWEQISEGVEGSELLRAMKNFSDFIYLKLEPGVRGLRIFAYDLRFSQYNLGFRAEIEADSEGKVITERFSYY